MTRPTKDPKRIVEAYLAGDPTAFARLVKEHEGPLLRFTGALLGDSEAAQDVVQDTFIRLLKAGEQAKEIRSISGWLFQVARRRCYDRLRMEKRMDARHDRLRQETTTANPATPEDPLLDREARHRVREALGRLPDRQREMLELKVWDGLSYREIGERLDLTMTNVRYHIGQAFRAMAGQLRAERLLGQEVL